MSFTEIFNHLNDNDIDVYSIGQHDGKCTTPYVVIKEAGDLGKTVAIKNYIVDILIYYPQGIYRGVTEFIQQVEKAMSTLGVYKKVYDPYAIVLDSDRKAYTTTIRYTKNKRKVN